jgi:hypothetical protein
MTYMHLGNLPIWKKLWNRLKSLLRSRLWL